MPVNGDPRPIGVFDSGIGGLTTVRELFAGLPRESVVYFGDTARLPYGNKSKETVTRFSVEIASFLVRQHVKCVVVACNTASSHALDALRAAAGIRGGQRVGGGAWHRSGSEKTSTLWTE